MPLRHKPIEQLNEADIQQLIEHKVSEQKAIEYKREVPGNSDKDKKEFLADVSSFANASGGDLLFGVEEENAIATKIIGINKATIDDTKLRLEDILRNCLQPRIMGYHIHPIPVADDKCVLIIRIPHSWNSPHMITFNGSSRFFTRNSAGKHQMDVTELRNAFLLGETLAEKIRNFRLDRLAKIVSGETPVPMETGAKLVLHVVPLNAFEPEKRLLLEPTTTLPHLRQISTTGYSGQRRNFDGLLTWSKNGTRFYSYTQMFVSGIVEFVDTGSFQVDSINRGIYAHAYEPQINECLTEYRQLCKIYGIETPIIVMLSLLCVRNYDIIVYDKYVSNRIDRNDLIVQETIVTDFNSPPQTFMKPAYDAVWNACGYAGSKNYDGNGSWKPKQ